jgi:hypothetical protein
MEIEVNLYSVPTPFGSSLSARIGWYSFDSPNSKLVKLTQTEINVSEDTFKSLMDTRIQPAFDIITQVRQTPTACQDMTSLIRPNSLEEFWDISNQSE